MASTHPTAPSCSRRPCWWGLPFEVRYDLFLMHQLRHINPTTAEARRKRARFVELNQSKSAIYVIDFHHNHCARCSSLNTAYSAILFKLIQVVDQVNNITFQISVRDRELIDLALIRRSLTEEEMNISIMLHDVLILERSARNPGGNRERWERCGYSDLEIRTAIEIIEDKTRCPCTTCPSCRTSIPPPPRRGASGPTEWN